MRYELKEGKFGFYFYDTYEKKDLPLEKVLELLNEGPSDNALQIRINEMLNKIREILDDGIAKLNTVRSYVKYP